MSARVFERLFGPHKPKITFISSDRLAAAGTGPLGNGILTFLSDKNNLQRFFGDESAAYFSDFDDLVRKLRLFQSDDALRRQTAASGQAFYREHFSGQRVVQYIIETTMGMPYSHDYIWQDEICRQPSVRTPSTFFPPPNHPA
jgi:hypothetical protein